MDKIPHNHSIAHLQGRTRSRGHTPVCHVRDSIATITAKTSDRPVLNMIITVTTERPIISFLKEEV